MANDINKDYESIVKHPGKFENEPAYVPYYWDVYLDGFADDDDGEVLTFIVTDDDRHRFPELETRHDVKLRELDNGFVIETF